MVNTPVSRGATGEGICVERIWAWLDGVSDPGMPVLSIRDLGMVRQVSWCEDSGKATIVVTPTYSGCPSLAPIRHAIVSLLRSKGVLHCQLEVRLAPAWTTAWMSAASMDKLRAAGIAPPAASSATHEDTGGLLPFRASDPHAQVACPRCHGVATRLQNEFSMSLCTSLHFCDACREPFEHFKCHGWNASS